MGNMRITIVWTLLSLQFSYAQTTPNSCEGILALVDRPSVAFSACTAPSKTVLIENGYNYQQLDQSGFAHVLPQTELRLGLIANTELDIFPAVYSWQSAPRQLGWGSTSIGLKHIAYFDAHQLITLQGSIAPPSGGVNYGSRKTGFLVNGIYNYNFDSGLGISALMGVQSVIQPPNAGSEQYYSVNPILIVGWPWLDELNSYIEFYGQSKTAPTEGWGVNADAGLIFMVSSNLTIDLVYGHRISGLLNNMGQYVGGGFVVKLG